MGSELKLPLVKLLSESQVWRWILEEQESFDQLKKALIDAWSWFHPNLNKPCSFQADASAPAIGVVLTKESNDKEHPTLYFSHVRRANEKNFSVTKKECLAVVEATKKFR